MINKWNWRKFQKGQGIKVKIPGDLDEVSGEQKYRPGIVLKSYPSHLKVQLMTTESSHHDYFTIKIDNQIQYIRPIYFRTIPFEWVNRIWKDSSDRIVKLDRNSTLFTKITEMEIKENLDLEINIQVYKQQENIITNLKNENVELKEQLKVTKKRQRTR